MAVYWHPFLAQFLRQDYGDRLIIQDEVPLGEMPPRADLILIQRDPRIELPFPFCYLGDTTLAEYKGPEDTAGQADLVQLEIYGLSYQIRQELWNRPDLTLWLLSPGFTRDFLHPLGAHLDGEVEVGPGVRQGTLDGFPTVLINLERLPLSLSTLPLNMVSRGERERELVEFVLDHPRECSAYLPHLFLLHEQKVEEVLTMRQITWEEAGVDMNRLVRFLGEEKVASVLIENAGTDMSRLLRLFGEENLRRALAESRDVEQFLRLFGEEKVIRALGEERALADLVRLLGKDRVRELLERIPDKPDGNGHDPARIAAG